MAFVCNGKIYDIMGYMEYREYDLPDQQLVILRSNSSGCAYATATKLYIYPSMTSPMEVYIDFSIEDIIVHAAGAIILTTDNDIYHVVKNSRPQKLHIQGRPVIMWAHDTVYVLTENFHVFSIERDGVSLLHNVKIDRENLFDSLVNKRIMPAHVFHKMISMDRCPFVTDISLSRANGDGVRAVSECFAVSSNMAILGDSGVVYIDNQPYRPDDLDPMSSIFYGQSMLLGVNAITTKLEMLLPYHELLDFVGVEMTSNDPARTVKIKSAR